MRRTRRRGFTLVEVMLVLAILMILATTAVVAYGPIKRKADIRAAAHQISAVKQALELYLQDVGSYPPRIEFLWERPTDATAQKWGPDPYLSSVLGNDPWGNPYQYACPGQRGLFDLYSAGPDGVAGTEDDVW